MATNNQINSLLSGVSGTGSYAGSTSATFVTPTLGAATATSLSFSSTSGIIGTTTNDNADAGSVGEYVSSSVLIGSAVSLSSGAATNLTSISLTAGDWDVCGMVYFVPDGTTTNTFMAGGLNTVSASMPTPMQENNKAQENLSLGAGQQVTCLPGRMRFSLSGTTTIYLVAQSTFAVSTMDCYGFLSGRRLR